MIARIERHRLKIAAVALAVAGVALGLVASAAGWPAVRQAAAAIQPAWVALAVAGQALALLGYSVAYRCLAAAEGGPRLSLRLTARVVTAGFGAFVLGGGFLIDHRALRDAGATHVEATERVLGLGALEYVVLIPVTWICAVWLLVSGRAIAPAVLWPWVLAVPVGLAVGMWASAPARRCRVTGTGRLSSGLRRALEGIGWVHTLARRPLHHWRAWAGMALYWAADIATLYAAIRLFGEHLGIAHLIVAYSTGYAATRRTLPLGGVGATEVLMCLALSWLGLPLAQAVPAVAAYRLANVALILLPAVGAHASLRHHLPYRPPSPPPPPTV